MSVVGILAAIALLLAIASFFVAGPLVTVAVILLAIALMFGNVNLSVK